MKSGVVYEIRVNGVRRYVGVTNNFVRRQKEHLRAIKKGQAKYLYQKINETPPELTKLSFNQISDELTILEARRFEGFLILSDWFNRRELWQSTPYSFKYF